MTRSIKTTRSTNEIRPEEWGRHWVRTRIFLFFWLHWTFGNAGKDPHPALALIEEERARVMATIDTWPERFQALAEFLRNLKIDHALQIYTTPPEDQESIRVEKVGAIWPRSMKARPPITEEIKQRRADFDHGKATWDAIALYPTVLGGLDPLHPALTPLRSRLRALEDDASMSRHEATASFMHLLDQFELGNHARAFVRAETEDNGVERQRLQHVFETADVPRSPMAEAIAAGEITTPPATPADERNP